MDELKFDPAPTPNRAPRRTVTGEHAGKTERTGRAIDFIRNITFAGGVLGAVVGVPAAVNALGHQQADQREWVADIEAKNATHIDLPATTPVTLAPGEGGSHAAARLDAEQGLGLDGGQIQEWGQDINEANGGTPQANQPLVVPAPRATGPLSDGQ